MTQDDLNRIHTFVDEGLKKLKEKGLMRTSGKVPLEMIDGPTNPDGWTPWKPIKSTVTDQEITQLEVVTACKFPNSFIAFLKYKHFFDLFLPDQELVNFYRHPQKSWIKEYLQMYSYDWVQEDLIANKIIPFANHYDYGFLCFDARAQYPKQEYPILMVDHELVGDLESYESFNANFMEMVQERLI